MYVKILFEDLDSNSYPFHYHHTKSYIPNSIVFTLYFLFFKGKLNQSSTMYKEMTMTYIILQNDSHLLEHCDEH